MYPYKCPQCGNTIYSSSPLTEVKCQQCGCQFNPYANTQQQYNHQQQNNDIFANGPSGKSRGVAGLFAILLGALGIQYFYIGKNTAGIVTLCLSIFSCGVLASVIGILTLIQGILMLTMTEQNFEDKYINNPATFVF